MKIDRILLSSALIATMALPSIVNAGMDFEISGVAKNETSVYTKKASETNRVGQKHEEGDLMKVESSLNLFINSEITDDISAHMQLNFVHDSEGIED